LGINVTISQVRFTENSNKRIRKGTGEHSSDGTRVFAEK
jgi:hypothetical protein